MIGKSYRFKVELIRYDIVTLLSSPLLYVKDQIYQNTFSKMKLADMVIFGLTASFACGVCVRSRRQSPSVCWMKCAAVLNKEELSSSYTKTIEPTSKDFELAWH
jgi:hypothetical protein